MTKLLNVPYRSQWDNDAHKSSADCGPACLAMLLDYYGVQARIDDLFLATGATAGACISPGPLMRVSQHYGLALACRLNNTLDALKEWLNQGKPVIALVQYRHWSQHIPKLTQDTLEGAHYVVVLGYDDQGHILLNDPNYWASQRLGGYRRAYPQALFRQAWWGLDTFNPAGVALIPTGEIHNANHIDCRQVGQRQNHADRKDHPRTQTPGLSRQHDQTPRA